MGLVQVARRLFDRTPNLQPDELRKAKPLRNPVVEETAGDDLADGDAPHETERVP